MAAKIKNVSAKNSTTSTKWLTNALKSIGVSANNVLKNDFAPNIYEAASSGVKTTRSLVSTIRKNVTNLNTVQKQVSKNKYVKFARDAYKNALQDLKSGNLNNEQRFEDKMMSDFGFDDFNFDDDFSFGDDGGNDIDINVMDGNGSNEAIFAVSTQLQKNQETTLKTNQASMDAMIAMNSASLMQMQQIGNDILGSMNTINENLGAIIEFNNTNMTRFVQSSLAFYERMGTKFDDDSKYSYYKKEKLNATSVFNNSNGGLNMSSYKDYIKQNIKDLSNSGMIGLAKTLLDDTMLEMAASNPVGFLTEGVVKWAIPKALTTGIKGAEEAFSSFMPALLHKFSEWGNSYAFGIGGNLKKIFGQVFGIKIERTEKFDKGSAIEKGPVPFDGITRHAITEVITKELRDQTAYLKAIAEHYKIDTKTIEKNARVFDYKTGKYTTEKTITDNIVKDVRDTTVNSMKYGKFGKELSRVAKGFETSEEQDIVNSVIEQLFYMLEMQSGKPFELSDKAFSDKNSAYNQIMKNLHGGKGVKAVIDKKIKDMVKNNPEAILDLRRSMLTASNDRNRAIQHIQENASEYGLTSSSEFDKKTIDQLVLESFKNDSKARLTPVKPSRRTVSGRKKSKTQYNKEVERAKEKNKVIETMSRKFTKDEIKKRLADSKEFKYPDEEEDESFFSFFLSDEQKRKIRERQENDPLGKALNNVGRMASSTMLGILHGNSDEAFNNLMTSIGNTTKELFNKVKEDFLDPLKESLFGSKDNDGFSRNGIFSGVKNGVADTFNMIKYNITGRGYKTSDGTVFEDKKEGTVLANLKKIGTEIKDGVLEKVQGFAFGKKTSEKEKTNREKILKVYEKDPKNKIFYDQETGEMKKFYSEYINGDRGKETKGAVTSFKEMIQQGLAGWSEAFFGKELTDDEKSKLGETIKKEISDRLPNTLTGSAIGAGLGMMSGSSLLGWMVGGPIGGIAIGTAVGFASKSEKFQDWLFGEKDEEGDRTGGFISKNVQDFFKEHKGALIGGTAIGAAKGMLFGIGATKVGGLLGSLVGGPIGGALMGLASSIVIKSKTFHEFLFGDEDTGQRGIFEHFQSLFKSGGGEGEESLSEGGKLLGMSFLGAGAGAGVGMISMGVLQKMGILGASLTPAGPIGGAIAGLAASIFAQRKNFSSFLFGKKDKDGNKIEEGIFGQFGNMVKVSVLKPLKDSMDNFIDDAKWTLTYKILDPIRFAVEPIGDLLKEIGGGIKDSVKGLFNSVTEGIKSAILSPLNELLLKPVTGAVQALSKAIWGTAKSMITLPFSILKVATDIITSPLINGIKKLKKFIRKKILTPIFNDIKKIVGGIFKGIGFVGSGIIKLATAPIKFAGGIASYISDKVYHVGGKDREKKKVGKKLEGKAEWSERLKQMRIDSANKIKNRKERRIRTKNEQSIAKATNYQRTEDTEENRKLARDLGFKINDRIAAVKDKKDIGSTKGMTEAEIAGADFKQFNEEAKHTNLLLSIRNNFVDFVKFMKKKISGKNSNETNDEDDTETNGSADSTINNNGSKNDNSEGGEEAPAQNGEEAPKNDNSFGSKIDKKLSSMGESIKTGVTGFFNKFKKQKSEEEPEPEAYSRLVYKKKYKAFVDPKTGIWFSPEEVKKGYDGGLYSNFKGKKFAKGTENAPKDEAVMVGEEGPELMVTKGGEKIFANSKPLKVFVVGASDNLINNQLSKNNNEDDSDKKDVEPNMSGETDDENNNTNTTIDSGESKDDNVDDSNATLGNKKNDKNQGKKGDSKSTIKAQGEAKAAMDKAKDKAKTAEELQEEQKEEEKTGFFKKIISHLKGSEENQIHFSDLWSTIFNKDGLITLLLTVGIPIVLKLFPAIKDLIGEAILGIGQILTAIGEGIKWYKETAYPAIEKFGEDIGNAFIGLSKDINEYFNGGERGTAYVEEDGSYYDTEGNYYDSTGNLIGKNVYNIDELSDRVADGILTMDTDFQVKKSGLSKDWSNLTNGRTKDKLSGTNVFVKSDGSWYDQDGNYYDKDGYLKKWAVYDINTLTDKVENGTLSMRKFDEFGRNTETGYTRDISKTINEAFSSDKSIYFDPKTDTWYDLNGTKYDSEGVMLGENVTTNEKLATAASKGEVAFITSDEVVTAKLNNKYGYIDIDKLRSYAKQKNKENNEPTIESSDSTSDSTDPLNKNMLYGQSSVLGFAKGTENAPKDEAVMVGEEGPELMVTKGGEKIYANSKPLQVVLTGVNSDIENMFYSLVESTNTISNINSNTEDMVYKLVDNLSGNSASSMSSYIINRKRETDIGYIDNIRSNLNTTVKNNSLDSLVEYAANGDINNLIGDDGYGIPEDAFIKPTGKSVWYDANGNYYKLSTDKNYYEYHNSNGDVIARVEASDVNAKLQAGLLTEGDELPSNTSAKQAVSKIQDSIKSAWNSAKKTISTGWKSFTTWINGGSGNGNDSKIINKNIGNFDSSTYGSKSIVTNLNKSRKNYGIDTSVLTGTTGTTSGLDGGAGYVPYYSQSDSRWKNDYYGYDGATMDDTGCGPTAMSMVASGLTGKDIQPTEMASLAEWSGMRDSTGTNANFINFSSNIYGLNSSEIIKPDEDVLYSAASNGPTVLLGKSSNGTINPYTSGGHYVVTDGVDANGNVIIKDPRGMSYNKRYSIKDLVKTTGNMWSFGGFGKSNAKSGINAFKNTDEIKSNSNKSTTSSSNKTNSSNSNNKNFYSTGVNKQFNASTNLYRAQDELNAAKKAGKDTKKKEEAVKSAEASYKASTKANSTNSSNAPTYMKSDSANSTSAREAWLTIVKEVKRQYAENPGGGHYSQGGFVDVTINGKTNNCRLDCSGYVSSCLNFFGVTDKINMGIYQDDRICMKDTGFTYYHFPGSWDQIGIGDIMSNTEHTQIYAGMIDGQKYVWSVGSNEQAATPDPTPMGSTNYDNFWSPDGAVGVGCMIGGTTIDSSGGNMSTWDKVSSFFEQFISNATEGMISGNWNTNYSFGSTSSGSSVSGTAGSGVLSGSNNAEKIFNYLRTSGLTAAGAAGIMGNFDRESGLISNNLQNDYESSLGYTDEKYTKAVDDGSYTNFANDSAGYGLAQWTYYTRKQNLLDFAKSNNKSIGDLKMQLDFLMKEMSENHPNLVKNLNAASSPESAAEIFEKDFENAGVVAMSDRTSAARKYYDLYKDKAVSTVGDSEEYLSDSGKSSSDKSDDKKNNKSSSNNKSNKNNSNTSTGSSNSSNGSSKNNEHNDAFYSSYYQRTRYGGGSKNSSIEKEAGFKKWLTNKTIDSSKKTKFENYYKYQGTASSKAKPKIPKDPEYGKWLNINHPSDYDSWSKKYSGGKGQGHDNSSIPSIRKINFKLPNIQKPGFGGRGNISVSSGNVLSSFNYNKNYSEGMSAQKYISNTDSSSLTTAINYIIGYLDAITNNTAGANDKLSALNDIKNIKPNTNNVIVSGNGNTNISSINGKSQSKRQLNTQKSTVSRNMELAEKISKGL